MYLYTLVVTTLIVLVIREITPRHTVNCLWKAFGKTAEISNGFKHAGKHSITTEVIYSANIGMWLARNGNKVNIEIHTGEMQLMRKTAVTLNTAVWRPPEDILSALRTFDIIIK